MMEQTRSGALPGQGGPVQLLRASRPALRWNCLLYTSDAADDWLVV